MWDFGRVLLLLFIVAMSGIVGSSIWIIVAFGGVAFGELARWSV